jgi:hypothetical protein
MSPMMILPMMQSTGPLRAGLDFSSTSIGFPAAWHGSASRGCCRCSHGTVFLSFATSHPCWLFDALLKTIHDPADVDVTKDLCSMLIIRRFPEMKARLGSRHAHCKETRLLPIKGDLMKTSSSRIRVILAAGMAICFSLYVLIPQESQAFDLFKFLRKNDEKAQPAQAKAAPVVQAPVVQAPVDVGQDRVLIRNQKLVGNMRAFRQAPPELKKLVTTILTDDELDRLKNLDIRRLQDYQAFRRNLETTGLTSIQTVLIRAKGTKFKTALAILIDTLARDESLSAAARGKMTALLQGISLMPFRYGDRHQFVAFITLRGLLDNVQLQSFSNMFINAHKGGKESARQSAVYREALKHMNADSVQMRRAGTVSPQSQAGDAWADVIGQALKVMMVPPRQAIPPAPSGSRVMSYGGAGSCDDDPCSKTECEPECPVERDGPSQPREDKEPGFCENDPCSDPECLPECPADKDDGPRELPEDKEEQERQIPETPEAATDGTPTPKDVQNSPGGNSSAKASGSGESRVTINEALQAAYKELCKLLGGDFCLWLYILQK